LLQDVKLVPSSYPLWRASSGDGLLGLSVETTESVGGSHQVMDVQLHPRGREALDDANALGKNRGVWDATLLVADMEAAKAEAR
jgi:hypothetical protein